MAHVELKPIPDERYTMPAKTRNILLGLIIIGLVLSIAGYFMGTGGEHHAADHGHHKSGLARVWANLLLNSWYAFLVAIAGMFFIAINYLANAGWATAIKRIPEAFGAYIPVAGITLLAVGILGMHDLYHWTDPEALAHDEVLSGKGWFLNKGWLFGGTAVIFCVYFLFWRLLRKASLNEDAQGGLNFFEKSITYSAIYTFFFGFSFSAMAWLWLMSLDAHWFSTIYSVYNFAISFVCGLAVITMIVLHLKKHGYLSIVHDEHLHDLGKFMFAFSIFWTYIWLAQYLLIWYANIPEESVYYVMRKDGQYEFQFWLNIVLCFIIPFLGLMSRDAKRNPKFLITIGTIILVGHWNDLYLMIFPAVVGENAGITLLEVGMPMIFIGLFGFIVLTALSKANLFPKNHPYLQESVHHDVGP